MPSMIRREQLEELLKMPVEERRHVLTLRNKIKTLRLSIDVGARANINARIGHLAESESAALEHAHAAAGTAAGEHPVAEELLRCVIPEGQTLEGYQHRTHPRLQSAV